MTGPAGGGHEPHPHDHDAEHDLDHGAGPGAHAEAEHDHPHPHPPHPAGYVDEDHPHGAEAHAHPHAGEHDHDGHGDHGDDHDHAHVDHAHPDEGHAHGDHDHHDHDHPSGIRGFIYELIKPHSHDSADSVDDAILANARGIRAVKVSLIVLMATAVAQVLLVLVTGSVALLADTIHNFSDALTSIPLWIAFILARRQANKRYTYGYRRAEDLAGLFIVLMIALSALIAGAESIQRLIDPHPLTNPWLVVAAGFFGFLGNEAVASYRIRVGKEIGSAALVADGYHARTDGFTSLAVVIGAFGVMLGFPLADPIVGLLITAAILIVLRDAVIAVFGRLMDAVDPDLVDTIERQAKAVPGVIDVSSIRVRWIGHRLEASLHAVVDCTLTVADGHKLAEDIRHAAYHDVKKLDAILVHIDPCDHVGDDHHERTRGHDPAPPPFVPIGYEGHRGSA
ncbi:MAG TPA: cation diffusion facilitator family transporter [Candidatus Limnocylindrales bacterium]|nr:cation diffusion facilitator family transporter [Candidatus Limnocylindrales bacterium]